jgi:hypothetical protein
LKKYILKEYGSWSVMLISALAGLFLSRGGYIEGISAILAISLFTNSKQALTSWRREGYQRKYLLAFILQVFAGVLILLSITGEPITKLLPYASIPVLYLLLLLFAGEHKIYTEITGFATLTLSSLIVKFASTGIIDITLYIAVAVFFIAGVFKVRVQLSKGLIWKILMMLYIAFSLFIYHLIEIPLIVLLPLLDNFIFSIMPYRVKLKVTGWIEVLKGIIFLLLILFFYHLL